MTWKGILFATVLIGGLLWWQAHLMGVDLLGVWK